MDRLQSIHRTGTGNRARARTRALPPTWRKLLLTLHIAAAAGLIGADLVLLTLGIAGLRGSDPVTIYPAMSTLAGWVLAPLAVIALITGVLQAVLSAYGLFRFWWVTIKLTITTLLAGLVLFVLVPGLGKVADAAGSPADASVTDTQRLVYVIVPSVAITLVVLMVGLGVFKPRWRLKIAP